MALHSPSIQQVFSINSDTIAGIDQLPLQIRLDIFFHPDLPKAQSLEDGGLSGVVRADEYNRRGEVERHVLEPLEV